MIVLAFRFLESTVMAEQVVLNLPDRLAAQVHEVAALTQRKIEDVLIEWLDSYACAIGDRGSLEEVAIEDLSDEQIMKLCDLQMSEPEQMQMSLLLEKQRESLLQQGELEQLDGFLQVYRRGMVRKAEALKVAVGRGLRARLG
jgi:hypothetical protein